MADDEASSTMSYETEPGSSSDINSSQYTNSSSGLDDYEYQSNDDDSNLDDPADVLSRELEQSRSALYEIRVDLRIDLPRDEMYNKPDIVRAIVYTIGADIFSKYPQWKSLAHEIVYELGRALCGVGCFWISVADHKSLYRRLTRINGHSVFVDQNSELTTVSDILEFHDFICATCINVNYTVDVFLSPGIAGAREIYERHGFKTSHDSYEFREKYLEDIYKAQKSEPKFNHHLAWATVYNILYDYRENIAKQNLFFQDYGFPF